MPADSPLKGIEGLYECCCSGFYEWIATSEIVPGQICKAPIWYNDAEALTLIEDVYNIDESQSTWKLTNFSKSPSERLKHRPYKTFQLESDDDVIVVKCKIRPVLTIKKISSDWRVPGNSAKLFDSWLCLPLFSYKPRHTQEYVISDQRLDRAHHFYFPPGIKGPGVAEESAGKLLEMQFIPHKNISTLKSFCIEKDMFLPMKLTNDAFRCVAGHIALLLPTVGVDIETERHYSTFRTVVQEEIDIILASS